MGMQGIRVGVRGIIVGKQGIRMAMWGIMVGIRGMGVGICRMRAMRGIRVGMRGRWVGKTKVRVHEYFCNALFTKTDLQLLQKYWRSLKKNKVLKIIKPEIYLSISIKTLNSRKEIFNQECENASFVKINLRKIQF